MSIISFSFRHKVFSKIRLQTPKARHQKHQTLWKINLIQNFLTNHSCWFIFRIGKNKLSESQNKKSPSLIYKTFILLKMAEREGFEPSIWFPIYTRSRRAPSTTRPPLQIFALYPERNNVQVQTIHSKSKKQLHLPK